jgi:hypothetical protein
MNATEPHAPAEPSLPFDRFRRSVVIEPHPLGGWWIGGHWHRSCLSRRNAEAVAREVGGDGAHIVVRDAYHRVVGR